jgi:hypothetical protein
MFVLLEDGRHDASQSPRSREPKRQHENKDREHRERPERLLLGDSEKGENACSDHVLDRKASGFPKAHMRRAI